MRPLLVEVEGFSTFRERVSVDFEGVDLAAFVGPTGSGKSSVLDAIPFALYGSVPRYGDNRLIAPVVHQLVNEAKVRLDFEVGGERYTAVRVVRRTGARAQTRGVRLERWADAQGADREVLAATAAEMGAAVAAVIGLDFEQFTKTVLLPQGEFAALLHQKGSERQTLLRQLLDLGLYERVGRAARVQQTLSDAARESAASRLATAPSPDQLAEAEAKLARFLALQSDVADRLGEIRAATARSGELRSAIARDQAVIDRLDAIVVPDDVRDLGTREARAAVAAAEATAAVASAEEALAAVQTRLAELPDAAVVAAAIHAHDGLDTLRAERAQVVELLEALDRRRLASVVAAADASAALEAAEREVEAATTAAGAAAMVEALRVGEPCPVCLQPVESIPEHHPGHQLRDAKAVRRSAKTAADTAAAAVGSIDSELAVATSRRDDLDERLADTQSRVAAHPDRGAAEATRALIRSTMADRETADGAVRTARAAAGSVTDQLTALRREASKLRVDLTAARDAVVGRNPPPLVGESLLDDWTALASWALDCAATMRDEVAASTADLSVAEETSARLMAGLVAVCESAGIAPDEVDPERLDGRIGRTIGKTEENIAELRRGLEDAERLRAELAQHERDAAVAGALAGHLRATGLERWLLAEVLGDLVARASLRLLQLSDERYELELSDTADFEIRDRRNGDEVRSVRTLSGGETFLASLALALALADSIAEMAAVDAPQLDAVFLDEGFGTLDADTLDSVAAAIDELGASGRMVCIVTHIRELAERMPVRFEVAKGPTTSTVSRVDA